VIRRPLLIDQTPSRAPRRNGVNNNGMGRVNGLGDYHEELPAEPLHDTHRPDMPRYGWLERYANPPVARRGKTYQAHYPEMCFQLRLLGSTRIELANAFGVTEQAIQNWIEQHQEFADAFWCGGDLADARVAESMFHRANGYSHAAVKITIDRDGNVIKVPYTRHYPADPAAGQYWLNNRQRAKWRTRINQELTGADGNALVPPQLVINAVKPEGNSS
jgi:hypothetical protein